MDYPANVHLKQICNRHNQPMVLYDALKKEPNCIICLQEKTGMVSLELYSSQLNEIINKQKENFINDKQLFQNVYNSILNYKNSLIWSLDKLLQLILDQVKTIDLYSQKFQQQIQQQNLEQNAVETLQKECSVQQESNIQIINQVQQKLEELKMQHYNSYEQLIAMIVKPKLQKNYQGQNEPILVWKKLEYEIIKESNLKQNQWCQAFSFNSEGSVLVAACTKEIVIYQFLNGAVSKLLQRLTAHTNMVNCLHYMKNSNSFISGSEDNSIIIWEFKISQDTWFAEQILIDHQKAINCLLMDKNEDLLISGSNDQLIKFWRKVNNQWTCQQTFETQSYVCVISLNDQEDKLISCGQQPIIQIRYKGNDSKWARFQSIKVSTFGSCLGFIKGDQFIFQSFATDYLEVYDFDQSKQQFQLVQKIQIKKQQDVATFFPCQYIKQLGVITVKHGQYLNIFKINLAGEYSLIQSIEFQDQFLCARLTVDGQYLITWDKGSKVIQVRKLKLQQ